MIKRGAFYRFLVILIICLTASYAIVYTGIQGFSEANLGGNTDTLRYLAMYRGEKVSNICWPSRALTPFLARILPHPPTWLFAPERKSLTPFWIAVVKFGIVNFIFLNLTGILFFYFLLSFNFSVLESLLGVLLFYTSRPVIQQAGIPLVEAAGWFFLLLCFYAIQQKNLILLVIGFGIGMFAKEIVFLALPAILFLKPKFWQSKYTSRAILILILGSIICYVFRFHIYHINPIKQYLNIGIIHRFKPTSLRLFTFSKLADLFSSFNLLWFPALYALIRCNPPTLLYRWSYLVIVMLIMILLFGLSLGRMLFYTFPVVIPLALYGIRGILEVNIGKKK